MLVIGYVRATDAASASIKVPPFHTGHLGFVPGTPVRVGLVHESDGPHREVIVTPFKTDPRDLALVTVGMKDQAGVVSRLVRAVAALNVNIEVLESASVKLLDNHSVTLLVDLSGRTGRVTHDELTSTADRRFYQGYDSVFPVGSVDCMHLFESIFLHCAEMIEWRTIAGEEVPDIEIRGYPEDRTLRDFVVRPLVADTDAALHARIDLPSAITNGLRSVESTDGQLEYLLVSDTTTRSLHAFFMQGEHARRVFHVGFYHDDVPGALATILSLLREAEFNILTSLVRKQEDGRSVWEAVLQYQGGAEVPGENERHAHDPVRKAEITWICERLVEAHEHSADAVVDCAIDVAPPRYPRRPGAPEIGRVSLSSLFGSSTGSPAVPAYDPTTLHKERLDALAKVRADDDPQTVRQAKAARNLLELIRKRRKEHGRPGIFLSYPHVAADQGQMVFDALNGPWRVERYQKPDGEVILNQVISRIENCDYFIGIWHPDEVSSKPTKNISPWMLFEYGVAHAAGKKTIVVHSDQLDHAIWHRINAGVANPEYTELKFDETVRLIVDYCERNFV